MDWWMAALRASRLAAFCFLVARYPIIPPVCFFVACDQPVADPDDTPGLPGDILLVRDNDDGVAVQGKLLEQGHDFRSRLGIEISRRLVGKQNRRLVDKRAGDSDALALAAGKFVRLVMDAVGQADAGQRLHRDLPAFVRGNAGINQRQFHIAQRVGARQQVECLENKTDFAVADFGELVVVHLAHAVAVQLVFAGGRRVEAADEVHQRGFAGAARPHDGDVIAALDVQRNFAQRVDDFPAHLVAPRNFLQSDQAHGCFGADSTTVPLTIFLPSSRSRLMA